MRAKSQMAGAASTSQDIGTFSRDARVLLRPSPEHSTTIKRGSGGRLHRSGSVNFITVLATSMQMIWIDPGRPPGQARVLDVVDPAAYHGAGSRSIPPTSQHEGELRRVDGTLACYHRGGNAIAKLGPLFNASLVTSLPPTTEHGGEAQRVDGTLTRCSSTGDNAIPKQVRVGSCSCPGAVPMALSSTTRPLTWVDGTLTCYARGDNAITELGASSVSSLSTHHNGTGSYCGGTPCRHDHLLLGLTHFSPSLVPTTASEASPGIVSRRIGVRRVGLG